MHYVSNEAIFILFMHSHTWLIDNGLGYIQYGDSYNTKGAPIQVYCID